MVKRWFAGIISVIMFVLVVPVYAVTTDVAVSELETYYKNKKDLTNSYWDVFAADAVLGDAFDKNNYKIYDVTTHKQDATWQATDYGAIILLLTALDENPYNYNGRNYVAELIEYYDTHGFWGGFANPIWAGVALEAVGADGYDSTAYLKYAKAQLSNFTNGCDVSGWSLILLSNHMQDLELQTSVKEFSEKIKEYQVQDGEYTALFDTGGMAGSLMTLSTSCVVSGLSALGEDVLGEQWSVNGISMIDTLYNTSIKDKKIIHSQIALAVMDSVNKNSYFNTLRITKKEFEGLLKIVSEVDVSVYTEESAEVFRLAYENAVQVSLDVDKMESGAFGEAFFLLKDAYKKLVPNTQISVCVYGKDNVILPQTTVLYSGDITKDITALLQQTQIPFEQADGRITKIQTLENTQTEEFICFVNGAATQDVQYGDTVILKYCDNQAVDLNTVLVKDDAMMLKLDVDKYNVTSDIDLPQKGVFGSVITWISTVPDVISETGKVKRSKTQSYDIKLTASVSLGESGENKIFDLHVPQISSGGGGSTPTVNEYVTFEVIGDTVHKSPDKHDNYETWISKTKVKLEKGDTVLDVLERMLKENNMKCVEGTRGYISKIQSPDGVWLEEFDNGSNSGWVYTIDGEQPSESVREYKLSDAEKLVVRYLDDYQKDTSSPGTGNAARPTTKPTIAPSPTPTPVPTITPSTTIAPTKEPVMYEDIDSVPEKDAIIELTQRGILKGKTKTQFCPDDVVTRAEFISVLHRMSDNLKYSQYDIIDVSKNDWYYESVLWGYTKEICKGDGKHFFPDGNITREDFAVMWYRFNKNTKYQNINKFLDDTLISDYAKEAVYALFDVNNDTLFSPKTYITRGEMAKLIAGM